MSAMPMRSMITRPWVAYCLPRAEMAARLEIDA